MSRELDALVRAAQDQGLLPPEATAPQIEQRPWPVVLLTALGAWLAAVPLLGVIGLLLGDLAARGAGTYAVGALLLAGAVVVLRRPEVPVFLEQLAVPALLSGAGALAFALARDLPDQGAAAVLALLALAIATLIHRPWLRVLAGASAAGCVAVVVWPGGLWSPGEPDVWSILHAIFGLWLLALAAHQRWVARHAALVESLGAGWLLVTLAGLAAFSGMTFLAPGVLGGGLLGAVAVGLANTLPVSATAWVQQGLSATLAAAGAAVLARAWPSLGQRQPWAGQLTALCLAALAFAIPTLGAPVLALALMLATRRWALASAAGVAPVWILGSFYHALAWPLAHKALVLVGCGTALGALTWWTLRSEGAVAPSATGQRAPRSWAAAAAIGFTVVATVGAVLGAIREKEHLIAHGRPIYVKLAPVDPRSLMQGDYMRLNFNLPDVAARADTGLLTALHGQRPFVLARVDARGVAIVQRLHTAGAALGADELLIELTPKNGQWTLVTDAWFFREGEAARWQRAGYGEFRVGPDGRALLVGLADDSLRSIPR